MSVADPDPEMAAWTPTPITLAYLRKRQKANRDVVQTAQAKLKERDAAYQRYQQLCDEYDKLVGTATIAIHELQALGARYALQFEEDMTPQLPGTTDADLL
jgi:hypothetical protein